MTAITMTAHQQYLPFNRSPLLHNSLILLLLSNNLNNFVFFPSVYHPLMVLGSYCNVDIPHALISLIN